MCLHINVPSFQLPRGTREATITESWFLPQIARLGRVKRLVGSDMDLVIGCARTAGQ